MIPLFEMDEVHKFSRLEAAHRFISNHNLSIDGGDVVISSQQFAMASAWLNDPEYC